MDMARADIQSFTNELMEEPYWWYLGLHLSVSGEFLDSLDRTYGSRGVCTCLRKIFKHLESRTGKVLWKNVFNALKETRNLKIANRIEKKYLKPINAFTSAKTITGSYSSDSSDNIGHTIKEEDKVSTFFSDSEHNHQLLQYSDLLFDRIVQIAEENSDYMRRMWSLVCEVISPPQTCTADICGALRLILHQNLCFLNCSFVNSLSESLPEPISDACIKKIKNFKATKYLGMLANLKHFNKRQLDPLRVVTVELCSFWNEVSLLKFERLEVALFQNAPFIISAVSECTNRAIQVVWSLTKNDIESITGAILKSNFIKYLGIVSLIVGGAKAQNYSFTNTFADCIEAALKANNIEAAELLLAVCNDPEDHITDSLIDSEGDTILYSACHKGHKDIVEILINCGAKPNSLNCHGRTPLIVASYHGHFEIVQLLISKGKVDVNQVDDFGKSPLFHACSKGHDKIVSALVHHGANPNITMLKKETPLMASSEQGHVRVIECLLNSCSHLDINAKNDFNSTALFYACRKGHTKVVELLLNHGSDPNITQRYTLFTPLLIACRNSYVEIAKLLIKAKANLNSQESSGGTALYIAAEKGHKEIISILLKAGADPTISRDDRLTPLLAAKTYGHIECAELLSNNTTILPHAVSFLNN